MKEKRGILPKYSIFANLIQKTRPMPIRIKGGGRIHTYVVAVVFVGTLFTLFIGRFARAIGFRSREVVITSIFVIIISILFPFMLQRDLLWEWILISAVVLIICVLNLKQPPKSDEQSFPSPLVTTPANSNELRLADSSTAFEELTAGLEDEKFSGLVDDHANANPEYCEQEITTQESSDEIASPLCDNLNVSSLDAGKEELTLEEMLDRGFAAKERSNYTEAAHWFWKVVDLKPAPDIEVYVVMDLYEFEKRLKRETEARKLVLDFRQRSLPKLPPEVQKEFNIWLHLNDI